MAQFGTTEIGRSNTQAGFRFSFVNRVMIEIDVAVSGASVYLNAINDTHIKTVIYDDNNGVPGELVFVSDPQVIAAGEQWHQQSGFELALLAGVFWIGTLYESGVELYYSSNVNGEQSWISLDFNYQNPNNPYPVNPQFSIEGLTFSLFLEAEPLPQPQFIQMPRLQIGPVFNTPLVSIDEDSGSNTVPVSRRVFRV